MNRWESQNTITFVGFTWALLIGLFFETALRFWLLMGYALGYLPKEITKPDDFSYKSVLGQSIWREQFA